MDAWWTIICGIALFVWFKMVPPVQNGRQTSKSHNFCSSEWLHSHLCISFVFQFFYYFYWLWRNISSFPQMMAPKFKDGVQNCFICHCHILKLEFWENVRMSGMSKLIFLMDRHIQDSFLFYFRPFLIFLSIIGQKSQIYNKWPRKISKYEILSWNKDFF
jgi:hypothetical protein